MSRQHLHPAPGHPTPLRHGRHLARLLRATLALALATVPLAACGRDEAPATAPIADASTSPAPVPAGLESFYSQKLTWSPCGKGDSVTPAKDGAYECTTASVPLDYDHPDGTTITLALKRTTATGDRLGSLLVNPGGPGGSGVELVDSVKGYFSDHLLEAYDVVGFDPRGVGASTAVDCLSDAELDAERAAADATPGAQQNPDEARADVADQASTMAQACQTHTRTAGLLDHIDTVSAARDLDILRAALGQPRLAYLGYSYGTYLGATYAELFPTNVGRMVLDGAIDPTLSAAQLSLDQAKGFEAALRSYVKDCQASSGCPLTGSVDNGVTQIRELLDRAATSPIPTSDTKRPLTYSLAMSAIVGVMYQDESWSVLTEGLNQAMLQNDGSTLLYIADVFASRNADGTYSGNGDEVINAINCLDYPVQGDETQWDEQAAQLRQASPTFGGDLAYSDLYCRTWGHTATREHTPIRAAGAPPILVVGTTQDPATPYAWSKALASQLSHARLVTWEGRGHTAYGRAGGCVTTAVDDYLLAGTLPKEGLVCTGQD